MKKYFLLITLFLTISGCAVVNNSDEPVSSDDPDQPISGGYNPSPADSKLKRGIVFLDSADLLTLESFPLQFTLALKGNLPTPCHELRVAVGAPDPQNKIAVDVYSIADPNAACAQMLKPFEANISLGSFSAGKYELWVNGVKVADFAG